MHGYARQVGKTVPELMSTLSQRDVIDAMIYEQMNPAAEWRQDWRIAQLQATLCNIFGNNKSKTYSAKDFMPKFEPDDPDEQKRKATEKIQKLFSAISIKKGK